MADVVRLSIVYDTSQAAGNLNQLNRHLTRVTGGQKKAAFAALSLAQSMESGSISALGMAKSLGNVAGVIFGPWGVAIGVAVGVLTLFANRAAKAREEQNKLADEMRVLTRTVDQLLRPSSKQSDFGNEVQRLTDMIHDLDRAIEDANSSWSTLLQGGLAAALMGIPGMGSIGQALLPGAPSGVKKRAGVKGQLNRLTEPGAEANAELDRYNKLVEQQGRLLGALNEGPFAAMDENIRLLREHLENLGKIEGPEAALAFEQTAAAIRSATEALRQQERQYRLLQNAFDTMASALEDFVVTGTLAFTDFLNNILRLLIRDMTGELVGGLMRSVGGSSGAGSVDAGDVVPVGTPSGSVATNVTFQVQTMDAQGVAAFLNNNGAQIAAVVAGQAGRSAGIRRKFQR